MQPFQRTRYGGRPLLRLASVRSCASAQVGQKRMSSDRVTLRGTGDWAPAAETNRHAAAASTIRIMWASEGERVVSSRGERQRRGVPDGTSLWRVFHQESRIQA